MDGFSTVIPSDSGHFCCLRPGRTTDWQARCVTTEFCRISTTCTDLDNAFFQKPGLRFKQSTILPAYQFPRDCEEGKEKTQSRDAFDAFGSRFSIWGLAVGTAEQHSQSPGSLTGALGRKGGRVGANHKI